MFTNPPRTKFNASPKYQPILRELGIDAEAIFDHPEIVVWRSIRERQNCTLDADLADGRHLRLHIKRHIPERGTRTPADEEALGIRALEIEGIPTVPLVGWGKLVDGRSFIITEDLTDYRDAEKAVREGLPFDSILESTADVRLIDAARVTRLPGWPMRQRWIVKDLAQFWYSTKSLAITDDQRMRWLSRYGEKRNLESIDRLRGSIDRKSAWIARHDARLRKKQKDRNVSIPE